MKTRAPHNFPPLISTLPTPGITGKIFANYYNKNITLSITFKQRLPVSGDSVYIKVRAINNNDASSEVTCILDNYDVTLPTGRLEADFTTTSNRYFYYCLPV